MADEGAILGDAADERTPAGFRGYDGPLPLAGLGWQPEFWIGILSTWDGPGQVVAWACGTCGAIVPGVLTDLHREWHQAPAANVPLHLTSPP